MIAATATAPAMMPDIQTRDRDGGVARDRLCAIDNNLNEDVSAGICIQGLHYKRCVSEIIRSKSWNASYFHAHMDFQGLSKMPLKKACLGLVVQMKFRMGVKNVH